MSVKSSSLDPILDSAQYPKGNFIIVILSTPDYVKLSLTLACYNQMLAYICFLYILKCNWCLSYNYRVNMLQYYVKS